MLSRWQSFNAVKVGPKNNPVCSFKVGLTHMGVPHIEHFTGFTVQVAHPHTSLQFSRFR